MLERPFRRLLPRRVPSPAAALDRRDERGDVPGWVLIVVMSAGLVAGLTAVAGPQLQAMLESALSSVGG
ncbi:hypothetical protein [Mumia quercus]|uniref:hypothetical protein n=1 Tax=Mumia quercus TaxID=2976125 RepID=UPI0021D1168C|nr:hypothetical protein [Mumia quercus]